MNNLLAWGLIFLSAFCETFAALVVKMQFNLLGDISIDSLESFADYMTRFFQAPLLMLGLIAFFISPAAWFIALNRVQLSVGYPVLVALHLIFVAFFGVVFLGEPFSMSKIIGFVLVMVSLYFFRHVE